MFKSYVAFGIFDQVEMRQKQEIQYIGRPEAEVEAKAFVKTGNSHWAYIRYDVRYVVFSAYMHTNQHFQYLDKTTTNIRENPNISHLLYRLYERNKKRTLAL